MLKKILDAVVQLTLEVKELKSALLNNASVVKGEDFSLITDKLPLMNLNALDEFENMLKQDEAKVLLTVINIFTVNILFNIKFNESKKKSYCGTCRKEIQQKCEFEKHSITCLILSGIKIFLFFLETIFSHYRW